MPQPFQGEDDKGHTSDMVESQSPGHADAYSLLLDIRLAHRFLDTAENSNDLTSQERFRMMVDRAIEVITQSLKVAPFDGSEIIREELNVLESRFRRTKTQASRATGAGV